MKTRLFAIIILCSLLLHGCALPFETGSESVQFFYPRKEFKYGTQTSVMQSEVRDMTGHSHDLTYIISMYLMGPEEDSLQAAFPKGTSLLELDYRETSITATLSQRTGMAEIDFTLASVCLAKTCLAVTPVEMFTVICGSRSITLTESSLLMYDSIGITDGNENGGTT